MKKLSGLALKGRYPAVSTHIVMDSKIYGRIIHYIIKLGHLIPDVQVSKFISNQTKLIPAKPKLNGRVGWDSRIKALKNN